MKQVAVILSGCGVFDGSEIHESVLTLLALDRAGAVAVVCAPNIQQRHVVNHQTNKAVPNETRNVLHESARIARGAVEHLEDLDPGQVDAVILPGGFGAAKNLSTFAAENQGFNVDPTVARFLREIHKQGKPMGFVCIAPVIAVHLFGRDKGGLEYTIGDDASVVAQLDGFGGVHKKCAVDDVVVDTKHKIVTTPAYMLARRITEAETGINKLVQKVLELA